jgi:hypothetical protein
MERELVAVIEIIRLFAMPILFRIDFQANIPVRVKQPFIGLLTTPHIENVPFHILRQDGNVPIQSFPGEIEGVDEQAQHSGLKLLLFKKSLQSISHITCA